MRVFTVGSNYNVIKCVHVFFSQLVSVKAAKLRRADWGAVESKPCSSRTIAQHGKMLSTLVTTTTTTTPMVLMSPQIRVGPGVVC